MRIAIMAGLLAVVLAAGPAPAATLWSAGVETGDLREWYEPCPTEDTCGNEGGGEFNSGGGADTVASTEQAHTGTRAAKMTLNSGSESGTRMFRWEEARSHSELYYTSWSYIPVGFAPADGFGWWMHEGWKARDSSGTTRNMLHLELDYTFDPAQMYLRLRHHPLGGGSAVNYTQRIKALPVGQWFMTQTYVRSSTSATGQIIVWVDGTEIFNLNNIVTRFANAIGTPQWEVTNYGSNLTPVSVTKYVDDLQISTERIGTSPNAIILMFR